MRRSSHPFIRLHVVLVVQLFFLKKKRIDVVDGAVLYNNVLFFWR